jgi:single-strand DNA-binding protein
MSSFNKVILMGNLTKDPEVRFIPSGTAVADLSLAINETFKNKSGEQTETTCFVDVVVWARQAETCGEYLSKGSPILIEGRLQLDKWTSKEGENRSKLRVRADRVQFLSSPRDAQFKGGDAPAGNNDAVVAEPTPQPPPDVGGEVADDDNLPF